MPNMSVKTVMGRPAKNGDRVLLVFGRISPYDLEVKDLKKRNPKRPYRYVGRRKRTAVVLTVAKGRGQRKA